MNKYNAEVSAESWKSFHEESKHTPRKLKSERSSLQRGTKNNVAAFCKYESA